MGGFAQAALSPCGVKPSNNHTTVSNRTCLQRWNDRTRLATLGSKQGFSGFESQMQSTVRQIEHVLADRARLVARTQRKRSDYVVLGR